MRKLAVLTLITFFLVSCGEKNQETPELFALKNCILTYNNILAEGYKTMDMNMLLAVATEKRTMKAYHHMAALGEGHVRMEAELQQIQFGEIHLSSADKAIVKTMEKWKYDFVNIDTKKKTFTNVTQYILTYTLTAYKNKWFVDEILINEEKEAKKALDAVPFLVRPPENQLRNEEKNSK